MKGGNLTLFFLLILFMLSIFYFINIILSWNSFIIFIPRTQYFPCFTVTVQHKLIKLIALTKVNEINGRDFLKYHYARGYILRWTELWACIQPQAMRTIPCFSRVPQPYGNHLNLWALLFLVINRSRPYSLPIYF